MSLFLVLGIFQPSALSQSPPRASDGSASPGDEANGHTSTEMMLTPARPSVDKGLQFLAERQLDNGAFASAGYGRNAAVVALAGMAWLSSGSTPGRGPYGEEVAKAADYLLDHAEIGRAHV